MAPRLLNRLRRRHRRDVSLVSSSSSEEETRQRGEALASIASTSNSEEVRSKGFVQNGKMRDMNNIENTSIDSSVPSQREIMTTEEEESSRDPQERMIRWTDEEDGHSLAVIYTLPFMIPAFLRFVVLLLHPDKRKFEFLHFECSTEDKIKISDILVQIPRFACSRLFRHRRYVALCRRDMELINLLSVEDCNIREGDILAAVPDGFTPRDIMTHAHQLLSSKPLRRAVKKARLAGRGLQRLRTSEELAQRTADALDVRRTTGRVQRSTCVSGQFGRAEGLPSSLLDRAPMIENADSMDLADEDDDQCGHTRTRYLAAVDVDFCNQRAKAIVDDEADSMLYQEENNGNENSKFVSEGILGGGPSRELVSILKKQGLFEGISQTGVISKLEKDGHARRESEFVEPELELDIEVPPELDGLEDENQLQVPKNEELWEMLTRRFLGVLLFLSIMKATKGKR